MTELKPCPFCGGEAELVKDRRQELGNNCYVKVVHVACRICGAQTRNLPSYYACTEDGNRIIGHTPQDAIDAWNRRYHDHKAEVERLRETAERLKWQQNYTDQFEKFIMGDKNDERS